MLTTWVSRSCFYFKRLEIARDSWLETASLHLRRVNLAMDLTFCFLYRGKNHPVPGHRSRAWSHISRDWLSGTPLSCSLSNFFHNKKLSPWNSHRWEIPSITNLGVKIIILVKLKLSFHFPAALYYHLSIGSTWWQSIMRTILILVQSWSVVSYT